MIGMETLKPLLKVVMTTLCFFNVYWAPIWFRNTHTRLIDSDLNDALRIVTGYLRPTPIVY